MTLINLTLLSFINIFIGFTYIKGIYAQKVTPSLSMWLFFCIATGGSLLTFLQHGDHSVSANLLNLLDLGLVLTVTTSIIFFGKRPLQFGRFDTGCLVAVLMLLGFWGVAKNALMTNIAIQAIMVLAYLPATLRLWRATENTESWLSWSGLLAAPLVSLLTTKGFIAHLYSLRCAFCVLVYMAVMLRAERHSRTHAKNPCKTES